MRVAVADDPSAAWASSVSSDVPSRPPCRLAAVMIQEYGHRARRRIGMDGGILLRLPEQVRHPLGARLLHLFGDCSVPGGVDDAIIVDAGYPSPGLAGG